MTLKLPDPPARQDLDLIIKWIEETRTILERSFNIGIDGVRLKGLHTEPKKPRPGDVVYVLDPTDPSHWDPAGDDTGGYFGYHASGWVRLG